MRQRLRKKKAKEVSKQILENSGIEIKGEMDRVKIDHKTVILVDGDPLIIEHEGRYYLSVYGVLKYKPEKWKIVVDEGAMPFLMNGADIMKPGIVYVDDGIRKGDFVYITLEGKDTPLAVGISLEDSENLMGTKGKAVENLHYLKDKVWNSFF